MARDTATITELTVNTAAAYPTGTAINVSNGGAVPVTKGNKTLLWVKNTAGAEYDLTIKAGDSSTTNLVGDLVIPVAATTGHQIIAVDTARYMQDDGNINFDFETSMTGFFGGIQLP